MSFRASKHFNDPSNGAKAAFPHRLELCCHIGAVSEISQAIGGEVLPANVRKFTTNDFYSYQQGLVDLAFDLQAFRPHFVLAPLRGGLKPRSIVEGMLNGQVRFEEFPFTHKSHPVLAQQYFNNLRAILARHSIKNKDLRFGVLDAGIGGDSSNILAKWLVKLHEELGGVWRVDIHILHTSDRPPKAFEAVGKKSQKGIRLQVKRYVVSHLIVEDWNEGLGLRTEFNGEVLSYKPSVEPGAVFITRQDGTSFVYTSANVSRAVDKAISVLGTDHLFKSDLMRDPSLDSLGMYAKLFGQK